MHRSVRTNLGILTRTLMLALFACVPLWVAMLTYTDGPANTSYKIAIWFLCFVLFSNVLAKAFISFYDLFDHHA